MSDERVLFLPSAHFYQRDLRLLNEWKSSRNVDVVILSKQPPKFKKESVFSKCIYLPSIKEFLFKMDYDAQTREKFQERIRAAEASYGLPIYRLLLKMERNIGRAYSREMYLWKSTFEEKYFSKHDSYQLLIENIFMFLSNLLNQHKITVILGGQVGTIQNGIMSIIANESKIPYLQSMMSTFMCSRHYWTTDICLYNRYAEEFYHKYLSSQTKPELDYDAQLERFRKNPEQPKYILDAYRNSAKVRIFKVFKDRVNGFLYHLYLSAKYKKYIKSKPVFKQLHESIRNKVLSSTQKRFYEKITTNELADIKYIYLSLNQMPELVLNTQAPFWFDAKNLIKLFSYNLPYGYTLIVKENRSNVGRRPTKFLKAMLALPGVRLVDPWQSSFPIIKNADLVCTINGTTGWEGMMMKKRVLTLGYTHYQPLDIFMKYSSKYDFGALILKALQSDLVNDIDFDYKLKLFMKAEFDATVSDDAESEEDLKHVLNIVKDFRKKHTAMSTKDCIVENAY